MRPSFILGWFSAGTRTMRVRRTLSSVTAAGDAVGSDDVRADDVELDDADAGRLGVDDGTGKMDAVGSDVGWFSAGVDDAEQTMRG